MTQEWDETVSAGTTRRSAAWLRGGVSIVLAVVAVALFVSFFAPWVGLPELAWHTTYLPSLVVPVEGDRLLDVMPAIAGVLSVTGAMWLW